MTSIAVWPNAGKSVPDDADTAYAAQSPLIDPIIREFLS